MPFIINFRVENNSLLVFVLGQSIALMGTEKVPTLACTDSHHRITPILILLTSKRCWSLWENRDGGGDGMAYLTQA